MSGVCIHDTDDWNGRCGGCCVVYFGILANGQSGDDDERGEQQPGGAAPFVRLSLFFAGSTEYLNWKWAIVMKISAKNEGWKTENGSTGVYVACARKTNATPWLSAV